MKIKLELSEEKYLTIEKYLKDLGIEIDDSADLILMEKDAFIDHLMVVNPSTNEIIRLKVDVIISIESYGHNVEVYTLTNTYKTSERLYPLIGMLNPEMFIRISNSVIISFLR